MKVNRLTPETLKRNSDTDDLDENSDQPQINPPYCRLTGNNVLAGVIDLDKWRLITAAGLTVLDRSHVVTLERRGDDETRRAVPRFIFGLSDGSKLTGRLAQRVLPVRAGDRMWQIPIDHFVDARLTKSSKPQPEYVPEQEKEQDEPATVEQPAPQGGPALTTSQPGQGIPQPP